VSEVLDPRKPSVVNVADFINRAPISAFQMLVVTLCSLVVLLDGFDTQSISFAAPLLAPHIGVKLAAFGPIFGAAQIGQMIGVLLVGPFADRIGRKSMVICAVAVFGVFSLLTVWVDSFSQLTALRFVTGLGLGAAMPNVFAIISEYAPFRLKATLVAGSAAAFPLGAMIGGALSAKLVPVYGWQVIFMGAGILPLLLTVWLLVQLPESIRFLVFKGGAESRVARFLTLIDPSHAPDGSEKFVTGEISPKGMPVVELFKNGRAAMTLLLWVPYFTGLLLLFFMYSWLPLLMTKAGLPIAAAIYATVLFNLGGVAGCLLQGTLIDRYGEFRVLGAAYLVAALCVAAVGVLPVPSTILSLAIVLGGICAIGAQGGANALTTHLYPTSIRASGLGWGLGIGRIGSIVGPVMGGILIGMNWDNRQLFLTAAAPGLIAALAIVVLARLVSHRGLFVQ
jgi:MFS transporter, AAHS family, 4-hydroxybenzoate transporter